MKRQKKKRKLNINFKDLKNRVMNPNIIDTNLDIILNVRNKPISYFNPPLTYKRATDDEEILNKLKVRLKDGSLTDNAFEFIHEYSESDAKFYNYIKNKSVYAHDSLNPHERNPYVDYYVEDTEHLRKLNNLLNLNEKGDRINLFDFEIYVQLGKKGSGKTIAQNVWLHNNNDKLEDNNTLWIRMNVELLYNLWKDKKDITTEEYFLGQLVYVFCKRFRNITYIDNHDNHNTLRIKERAYSRLMERIFNILSNNSSENDIQEVERLTKEELKSLKDPELNFQQRLGKQKYNSITDLLAIIEKWIVVDEKIYQEDGNKRLAVAPNRRDSFLIDHVFANRNSELFKKWIYLGKALKTFILNQDYHILYIVDGIDNINFENSIDENNYDKLLKELLDFPLSIKKGHNNEVVFMGMRSNTYEDLLKCCFDYSINRKLKNLDTAILIRQQPHNIAKKILEKRVDYIFKNHQANSYMATVLDVIREKYLKPFDEERYWNMNFRSFLYNRFKLAKYITFRYYWRSFKNEDERKHEDLIRDIEEQINIYEDINFYLNGEIFACDEKRTGDTDEYSCFNLFGFTNYSKPLYFIYIHILLLISKLDRDKRYNKNIEEIMSCLQYSLSDYVKCITRMVAYGMLEQRFRNDDFAYDITEKGKFILNKFHNNIHFLYYSSLDTKLPEQYFEIIKKFISPNDVSPDEKDRFYPPYCIIRGVSFLRYLKSENQKIFKNEEIMNKLNEKGININIFQLPETEELRISTSLMLEKCRNNNRYVKIIEDWLQTSF